MSVPTLGQRLRFLRKQQFLSQATLSKKIQISRQAYSAYERDVRLPNYQTLCKLTEIFEVPLEFLLGEYSSDDKKYISTLGDLEEGASILQEEKAHFEITKNKFENLGEDEQKLLTLFLQVNDTARKKTIAYLEHQVKQSKRVKNVQQEEKDNH